nr:hypothetical protein [Tanacetum cinerariifolium]
MAAKIKDHDQEISELKARVKGIMEIGEELGADKSTELRSNDTEEMVNVLSSKEATNILTSGGAAASVSFGDVLPTVGVPTVSGSFPTVSAIFTTASVGKAEVLAMFSLSCPASKLEKVGKASPCLSSLKRDACSSAAGERALD